MPRFHQKFAVPPVVALFQLLLCPILFRRFLLYYLVALHDVPGLYVYEDYYLVHLRDLFLQKESLEVFLCPAFKRLTGYDLEHHTELAFTLYMYLLNDRNLVQTAKTMNMHRSSLIYRFDKINELLGEIPASIAERQYYILSYQFSEEHYRHCVLV